MNSPKFSSIFGFLLCTGLVSCAHDRDQTAKHNDYRNDAVATDHSGPSRLAKVDFKRGTYTLSRAEKDEISAAIRDAKVNGKIDQVKVLAWADHDYSVGDRKASPAEINLASARATAVRDYIRDQLKFRDVDTHNMAQKPGAFAKLFKTDDYRLKTGETTPSPQRVLVLIEMDRDYRNQAE